jgi:hypothetical protein
MKEIYLSKSSRFKIIKKEDIEIEDIIYFINESEELLFNQFIFDLIIYSRKNNNIQWRNYFIDLMIKHGYLTNDSLNKYGIEFSYFEHENAYLFFKHLQLLKEMNININGEVIDCLTWFYNLIKNFNFKNDFLNTIKNILTMLDKHPLIIISNLTKYRIIIKNIELERIGSLNVLNQYSKEFLENSKLLYGTSQIKFLNYFNELQLDSSEWFPNEMEQYLISIISGFKTVIVTFTKIINNITIPILEFDDEVRDRLSILINNLEIHPKVIKEGKNLIILMEFLTYCEIFNLLNELQIISMYDCNAIIPNIIFKFKNFTLDKSVITTFGPTFIYFLWNIKSLSSSLIEPSFFINYFTLIELPNVEDNMTLNELLEYLQYLELFLLSKSEDILIEFYRILYSLNKMPHENFNIDFESLLFHLFINYNDIPTNLLVESITEYMIKSLRRSNAIFMQNLNYLFQNQPITLTELNLKFTYEKQKKEDEKIKKQLKLEKLLKKTAQGFDIQIQYDPITENIISEEEDDEKNEEEEEN